MEQARSEAERSEMDGEARTADKTETLSCRHIGQKAEKQTGEHYAKTEPERGRTPKKSGTEKAEREQRSLAHVC